MTIHIDLPQLQADFIRYAKVNTRSYPGRDTTPSTPGQTELAKLLVAQLKDLGLQDVGLNPANGFVTATLPANTDKPTKSFGIIAHLDTADYNAENVQPQVHPNYDGKPIHFDNGLSLTVEQFPALKRYFGQTLITGDGTTLLGVDDKAGIAGAVSTARYLLAHPEVKHGLIKFGFGPDEEIGTGADKFDAKGFATDFAYTLDNGDPGQIEYETFNAAQATVTIEGTSVHPGEAKDLMINANTLGRQLDAALPLFDRPEFSDGHEGYFLLLKFHGEISDAQLVYIIRDFDRQKFDARKAYFMKTIDGLNAPFDHPRFKVEMHDQYYNMADIINKDPYPLRLAEAGIQAAGMTPKTIPFRGGTDGSKITYQGIPTPNLFNGGINFHGPYEVVSTEAMGKIAETLVHMAELNAAGTVG
ncbi:peptidase T [Lacticaseibacillus paracasei]|uniref:peptidase T n=1 Tax=Lacticaseibacillus paracasei TaxID=1597 RepID=UPI002A5AE6A6|nr:peptidase T [Lacticaseibacillus paracasei]MDY0837199.1 peptidase T [Lacticaseibacillus paracasei]